MMIDEIAKKPAPAKKRPSWRRDRCENKDVSDSEVDEACGAVVG